jgi:hypothetical protein
LIQDGPERSNDAALSASRSLSPITVAPELTGRGGRCSQGGATIKEQEEVIVQPTEVDPEPLQEPMGQAMASPA